MCCTTTRGEGKGEVDGDDTCSWRKNMMRGCEMQWLIRASIAVCLYRPGGFFIRSVLSRAYESNQPCDLQRAKNPFTSTYIPEWTTVAAAMKNMRSVKIHCSRNLKKDWDRARHRAVQMRGALIDSKRNQDTIWEVEYNFRLPIARGKSSNAAKLWSATYCFSRFQMRITAIP